MVSETEIAVSGATNADNCMDEVDLETMKVVQEQFLAIDNAEVKEISERSKQVSKPSLRCLFNFPSLMKVVLCNIAKCKDGNYLEERNRQAVQRDRKCALLHHHL